MGDPFAIKSIDRSALTEDLYCMLTKIIRHGALLGPDLLDWIHLQCGVPISEPNTVAIVAQLTNTRACGSASTVVLPSRNLLPPPSSCSSLTCTLMDSPMVRRARSGAWRQRGRKCYTGSH
jgi:hypothetical protein